MSQTDDVYRRVGRGGAGNFISPKSNSVEAADKDLEAQSSVPNTVSSSTSSAAAAPPRTGRGGAGNFFDTTSAGEAKAQEQQDSTRTQAAVKASAGQSADVTTGSVTQGVGQGVGGPAKWGGRGGAGNWQSNNAQRQREHEEMRQREEEELRRRAEEAVDEGLRMPDRVHHGTVKSKT